MRALSAQVRALRAHAVERGCEQLGAMLRLGIARSLSPGTLRLDDSCNETDMVKFVSAFVRGSFELILDVFRQV
ncbi:MAG: hypothetical protein LC797_20460 [Chloroflexi bacterium]|nr:hypothetical protein [Chloroflexota bacterium]